MSANETKTLFKALLALCWLPLAGIVYALAFGAGLMKVAMRDGWNEFK